MDDFQPLLLHGAAGLGIWNALFTAASAMLCEQASSAELPDPTDRNLRACGECAACRLVRAGTHPDLMALVPEAMASELGLNIAEGAESSTSGEKRSPSKDIPIDAIRQLVDWAHGTSHRGGLKVAVVYPLDALAPPAANALLKTLEEPAPSLYFLTGTHHLDRILPTLRSRCRLKPMPRLGQNEALRILRERGVADPKDVANWCRNAVHGADPDGGLAWARHLLSALPIQGKTQGHAGPIGAPPALPIAVAALQKLNADMLRTQFGQQPLYLPTEAPTLATLGRQAGVVRLQSFWRRLVEYSGTAHFPLHAGLTADALTLEFKQLFRWSAH